MRTVRSVLLASLSVCTILLSCSLEEDNPAPPCDAPPDPQSPPSCGPEIISVHLSGDFEDHHGRGNGHINSPGRGHEIGRGKGHDKHHDNASSSVVIDIPHDGTYCAVLEATGLQSLELEIGGTSIETNLAGNHTDQGLFELSAGRYEAEVHVEAMADWTIDLSISEASIGSDCNPNEDDGNERDPEAVENDQPSLIAYHHSENGRTLALVSPSRMNDPLEEVAVQVIEGFNDEAAANPLAHHFTNIAYDLGPDGARFEPALVATLSWAEDDLDIESAGRVRAYLRSEGQAEWIPAVTVERSVEGRYIRVLVPHFTHLALGVPNAVDHEPYDGDIAGEYGKVNAEKAYGSGFFQNPFPDLSAREGGNSMNFVSQAILAGFVQSRSPLIVYFMRRLFDAPLESPLLWIDVDSGNIVDTAWSSAARMGELAEDATGSSGLYLEYVTHDTLRNYMDYDLVRKGDVILADMPSDLNPDPDFVPDGVMDRAFIVSDTQWWRWGYNEIRVSSQDFVARNVGLGEINEDYHYRALFTVYRPTDYAPIGTTKLAHGGGDGPGMQDCERCGGVVDANGQPDYEASLAKCQEMADSLVELFPEFLAEQADVVLSTHNDGAYCWFKGDDAEGRKQVECYKRWVLNGTLTNKTLFHEISHGMRGDRKLVGGSSGICAQGNCGSSEFQASIHEALYFPPERECTGGHYKFTDTAGNTRLPEEALAVLLEEPAIPTAKLWDFVLGREDTLVDYLGRFNLPGETPVTKDLFHGQTFQLGLAERECDDNLDNNENGATDCDDLFCATHPECSAE